MISRHERFFYLGETVIYTYQNLFKGDELTAAEMFSGLDKAKNQGKLKLYTFGRKTVGLEDIQFGQSGEVVLLFMATDPDAADADVKNRTSGAIRNMARTSDEDMAWSAHMIIDAKPSHDVRRTYPTAVENTENLSRSLMALYLGACLRDVFHVKRNWVNAKKEVVAKDFFPAVRFVAPRSSTLEGALDNGGRLKSVSWVAERETQSAWGDKAFPVREDRDVILTVGNKPTGNQAKDMLNNMWSAAKGEGLKEMKVTIEEVDGNSKTITADLRANNILENFFLRQKKFTGLDKPLLQCEITPRQDLIDKVLKEMGK